MILKIFQITALSLCVSFVFSQNVSGHVYDENENPIFNVSVSEEGGGAVFSDSLGYFELALLNDVKELFFSKEGYVGESVEITPEVLKIVLKTDYSFLFDLEIEELLSMEITTASKKSQKIKEVPANVFLLSREEIELRGYLTLEDLISDIPGFYSLGNSYFYGGTNYGVRGFSTVGSFTNVMIMVNGVNQMEDFSNGFSTDNITVPIQAIDRVEVIKGPMGVFYGATAFFGVINIITNEQSKEGEGNVLSTSYGSLNTKEAFVRMSDSQGDFSYTFNGSFSNSDGMEIPYSELQSNPVLLAKGYGIPEGNTTKNQLSYTNKYLDFSGQFKKFNFNVDFSERREGQLGLVPSLDFDKGWEAMLTSANISGNYKNKIKKADLCIRYTNSIYEYGAERISILNKDAYNALKVQTSAQEFEVDLFMPITSTIGLNAGVSDRYVGKIERQVDSKILGLQDVSTSRSKKTPLNTLSVFTEVEFRPFDKLLLIGGVRLEKSTDFSIVQYGLDSLGRIVEEYNEKATIGELQTIPRAAMIYSISDNKVLKVMFSQSKKRPSFVELDNSFDQGLGTLEFAEIATLETNYHHEFSKRINFNTSLYYNDLSNLIIRTVEIVDNTPLFQSKNKGKMTTIGLESNLKIQITDKWKSELSICYQKSNNETVGDEHIGLAFSPAMLGYFNTSYSFSDKLRIGVKARFVDEILAEWNPATEARYSPTTPSYVVCDLNISSTIYKGLYASCFVSNLFDSDVRYGSNQYVGWIDKGLPGYGRRVNFTLGYKF